jgi:hypothetical protein
MSTDRLKAYEMGAALDLADATLVEAARPTDRWAEIVPGGSPYRLLWVRLRDDAPGQPPDERYYGDEVRPAGPDSNGHMTWEAAPGGLVQAVIHNVAEAASGTHRVEPGTVVRVEERLDRSQPPTRVYLADVADSGERLARIVSFDGGLYTVQPVRREAAGYVEEGSPMVAVPNLGELWPDEAGYLAGPEAFDRYVRIFRTPAGWAMLLHPPRLV